MKRVQLGSVEDGIRGVTSGLTKDDFVVIAGLQNATPGGKVNPEMIQLDTATPQADTAPKSPAEKKA